MFRNRLTQLRKKANLTQEDLANELGIHRGTYSNYEAGNREPDYGTLMKLADLFDVTTDFLLGRTESPAPMVVVEDRNTYVTDDDFNLLEKVKKHPEYAEMLHSIAQDSERNINTLMKLWKVMREHCNGEGGNDGEHK